MIHNDGNCVYVDVHVRVLRHVNDVYVPYMYITNFIISYIIDPEKKLSSTAQIANKLLVVFTRVA